MLNQTELKMFIAAKEHLPQEFKEGDLLYKNGGYFLYANWDDGIYKIAHSLGSVGRIYILSMGECYKSGANNDYIKLFSESQLRELSGLDWKSFDIACVDVILTHAHTYEIMAIKDYTKLQASLMVVMDQKGLTWNGEGWVKK